jgi:hypothetical protein
MENKKPLNTENLEKIEFFTDININGNSQELPKDISIDVLVTDLRYISNFDFVEKYYPELLGKDFDKSTLDQEEIDDLIEYIHMTMTYELTTKDQGVIVIDGNWFDVKTFLNLDITEESIQASELYDQLTDDTDIQDDLDDLVERFNGLNSLNRRKIDNKVIKKTAIKFYFEKDSKTEIFAIIDDKAEESRGFLTCYAFIGGHSVCSPDYLKECQECKDHCFIKADGILKSLASCNYNISQDDKGNYFHTEDQSND